MKAKRGRGRPPEYVLDWKNKPVVGLSYHKTNNFYYNTHFMKEGGKPINFGSNKDEAIFKFRQYDAKKRGRESITLDVEDLSMGERIEPIEYKAPQWLIDMQPTEEMKRQHREGPILGRRVETAIIPDSLFWAKARELILNDITEARKRLNLHIEIVGSVLPTKSISLKELGELFFQRKARKGVTKRYLVESRAYWKEFIAITQAKTVRDVDIPTVEKYVQSIHEKANREKLSASWINSRFSIIKRIFRGSINCLDTQSQIDEVKSMLVHLNRMEWTRNEKYNPQPISKANYLKILSNEKSPIYKALWLFALNCGMRQSDLTEVKKAHVDMTEKTLVMQRPKTRVIRSAMLWDRTLEAISIMAQTIPNKTEYLFANSKGEKLSRKAISDWFRRTRKRLGMDEKVKFEHLRDAAQSIPTDENPESLTSIAILMGHILPGQVDSYNRRKPSMTSRVVKAIEDYYFGTETP